jgi:hypothetical protein
VKKGGWSMEEDIELFSLVVQFGCRWALLSRELRGTRSEHSIKNRYNSVVKSMRKQYRITSSVEVEQKILKYLRFRSNRQCKQEDTLNVSSDSKESRDRSREVKLEDHSEISNEPLHDRSGELFEDVFDVAAHLAHL